MTKEIKTTSVKIVVRVLIIAPLLIPSPLLKVYPLPPPLYVQLLEQAGTSQRVNLDDYIIRGRVVKKETAKGIASTSVVVLWGYWDTHQNLCIMSNVGKTDIAGNYSVKPPSTSKYETRKKIEGTRARLIFYRAGNNAGQPFYNVEPSLEHVHYLEKAQQQAPGDRLTYLETLSKNVTCSNYVTLESNLYPIKLKISEEAKSISRTNIEGSRARSLCTDALEEKIRNQDMRLPRIEVDRLVKQYVQNGACK